MMIKRFLICLSLMFTAALCINWTEQKGKPEFKQEITTVLRKNITDEAAWAMQQQPITITAQTCSRSAGGKHDFYSEGDYWWPDPKNPDGPYIQRDGMTNPENFVAHRLVMIRFSRIIGALA